MGTATPLGEQHAPDYAAWGHPHHAWSSIQAFLAAPSLQDGIHSIGSPGQTLDLLFLNGAMQSRVASPRVLPVFFSGAVTDRSARRPPFFSGVGVAQRRNLAAVCIADPSLALSPELALGWYAGSEGQRLQNDLAVVLAELARRSACELLLIGASGGGFAALYYASLLGDSASALALNPQTDWLEYAEASVRLYLQMAFPALALPALPGPPFRKAAADALRALGVEHSLIPLLRLHRLPRRLVYLQNSGDWHVIRHAAPFLDAADFRATGNGFFETDNQLMWFGKWGEGHEPPPRALVEHVIGYLLDAEASVGGLKHTLAAGPLTQYVDAAHAPLDLRSSADDLRLDVRAVREVGQVRIQARPHGLSQGNEQIEFAFYVDSGKERLAVRWYEPDSSFTYREALRVRATRVTAFARDAFGHVLQVKEADVEQGPFRVQIFGSCVSRDAFAMVEHGLVLAGCIARSSFASAFDQRRPPGSIYRFAERLPSAFQRRMVEWDLGRKAAPRLRQPTKDAVLLDLIDERFPLLPVEGALVTLSTEFRRTGYPVDEATLVLPGSSAHMKAWKLGASAFLESVGDTPLIVNRVYWARRDNAGEFLPDQDKIERNNAILDAMYEHLARESGLRFIDYPSELLVADQHHKWGPSPYHYVQAMYEHTMSELERLLKLCTGSQVQTRNEGR
jgi:hypothetical protein